ncbi:hypothetical protein D3C87_1992040 [compost metagenome]
MLQRIAAALHAIDGKARLAQPLLQIGTDLRLVLGYQDSHRLLSPLRVSVARKPIVQPRAASSHRLTEM